MIDSFFKDSKILDKTPFSYFVNCPLCRNVYNFEDTRTLDGEKYCFKCANIIEDKIGKNRLSRVIED